MYLFVVLLQGCDILTVVYPKTQSLVLFFFQYMLMTFTLTSILILVKLFADDTTLLYFNPNSAMTHRFLSEELNRIDLWAKKWFVKCNCNKSKVLTINGPSSTSNLLSLNNERFKEVESYRYFGMTFTKLFHGKNSYKYLH